ncbi:MAG TPA: multidrug ABC transporter permease, partial [Methylocystis sp.]|nr:multidrug ABC transporter permease [Methylocystis sp.]
VELIRFAFYQQIAWDSLAAVAGYAALFLIAAIRAYDPAKGMLQRRGG